MLKRPQWVKEKIEGREKNVPIQMTIKKKYTMQAPYANTPTMGKITGTGVDGMMQPGKMVDVQVHEGEGIIPNNAMQGLTGEEFQGLIKTLSSGNIDKNKLREAINMPTVSEFQTGGIVGGYNRRDSNRRSFGVPDSRAVDPPQDPVVGKQAETMTIPTVTRETITPPTVNAPPPVPQQTIQTEEVKAPEVKAPQPFEFKPPPPIPQQPVQATAEPAAQTTTTTPAETVTKTDVSKISPAGEMVRQGLQNILAEAMNVSEVDRRIADFYLQNTDASNAANLRVLESQISSDPDMSPQAKQAAIRGLQREAAANRSKMTGELAINAAERASKASRDLITYGGDERKYEEITKPMSDLEMQKMENDLGAQNWDEIQNMIDMGLGLNRVNEKLTEKGLPVLTADEFENIFQATPLGERGWQRDLAFADYLVSVPDPSGNNLAKAAGIYSEKYPGVDIDFSQVLTQQNAALFSQGLSQMASYIAAGFDPDVAIDAMKKDGTLDMLGGDETLAAKLYNAGKVNSLDEEWKIIESSNLYQGLLNSNDPADRETAANIKQFNLMAKMGMLDYDTLHEYKITAPDGTTKGSVYAKTAEEAQKQADGYGVGYTVDDTGNVDFVMREEPKTEIQGGVSGKWEEFKKSIPSDIPIDQDLYKRWESWQENNTGKYEDFLKTETPANKLQTINVGTNKELLDTENSKILIDAYKTDPESVKDKGYFYQAPTFDELKGKFKTETGGFLGTGETSTSVDSNLKGSLDSSIGQITEIPMGNRSVIGQVQEVLYNAQSVQMKIKKLDGKIETITIYDSDHGSYRPQPKYYGKKG